MRILVLNGSPKGDLSATMQSVRFIEKKFNRHDFKILNIAQSISAIEKKEHRFKEIIGDISWADAVIWGTPVYVCVVPSQLIRFIELIFERNMQHLFRGKYAAVITTSIRFFDHIAHNYLLAVCNDLDMNVSGTFSADSYDLLIKEERHRLLLFAEHFFTSVSQGHFRAKQHYDRPGRGFSYTPGTPETKINAHARKIVVITDHLNRNSNIPKMITYFKACFENDVDLIDLEKDVTIKGGCTGCVQCGFDHECIYNGRDDFTHFYKNTIETADIIILAGDITHRFFSAKFKQFFDRSFFNNHTPTLTGKQIGFLVSGPLTLNANIREFVEAYVEWQGANLVDIITDEIQDSEKLDGMIKNFAVRTMDYAASGYVKPNTFLGVGGKKIFRDDVWGRHRFVFQADHRHFEKHGYYDFPQYDTRAIETNEFMFEMTRTPEGKEAVRKMLIKEMIKPHKKKIAAE